jgi:hypothetical protein
MVLLKFTLNITFQAFFSFSDPVRSLRHKVTIDNGDDKQITKNKIDDPCFINYVIKGIFTSASQHKDG